MPSGRWRIYRIREGTDGRGRRAASAAATGLAHMPSSMLSDLSVSFDPLRDKTYQSSGLGRPIVDYLARKTNQGRSPRTLDDKERYLANLACLFPELDVGDFTPQLIDHWLATAARRVTTAPVEPRQRLLPLGRPLRPASRQPRRQARPDRPARRRPPTTSSSSPRSCSSPSCRSPTGR